MAKCFSRKLIGSLFIVNIAAMAILAFQAPASAAAPDYELKVTDAKFSESAKAKIEKAGGKAIVG